MGIRDAVCTHCFAQMGDSEYCTVILASAAQIAQAMQAADRANVPEVEPGAIACARPVVAHCGHCGKSLCQAHAKRRGWSVIYCPSCDLIIPRSDQLRG